MRCPDFADTALAQPVIADISDWPLIGTLLRCAQSFDAAQWLRVQIRGVRLVGGRGFGTADVYTQSGTPVASFAQESVVRIPRKE
ncbi:hypothetical protein MYSE111917_02695 [Mycobacterium senriense]|uniref:Acyl-CoA thioesterase-like C-terminal domain-containing protein n=1 Tax=Mycobacterium senriense TaxID=2775496 RepID=A0ABN6IDH5_9MYCO|nr:hypothetical protein [Mycobacterium senriense]BCZ21752.1 hypothetical protein MTY59_16070 [Mycobacterium senriense]